MNLCPGHPFKGCGQDFATVPAFDAHRVGKDDYTYEEGVAREKPKYDGRRCLDVSELADAGWKKDRWGRWKLPDGLEPPLFDRVAL